MCHYRIKSLGTSTAKQYKKYSYKFKKNRFVKCDNNNIRSRNFGAVPWVHISKAILFQTTFLIIYIIVAMINYILQ